MSLSDRHLLLVSRGLLLPLPPNSGPVPRCHMSHPRDAGVRDSAKHAEAQGGRVTYSRTRTQAGTGSMTSVPALPSGPLLPELLVGSPAQGRTGRTSVGPAQALPCVCQGDSRAGSLCAQLCAGCLQTPSQFVHFTDEETEAYGVAATGPGLSVVAQTWAPTVGSGALTR